ncbi:MAG: BatA and WFA domain-containing protein [Bacteroidia bacterium]|nr:BatA and WFA domain-containing protein [Bacteroidia bacterium]
MKFLFPQFLWALLLLVIPLIIHLFNFRRYKKVVFSNVSMLKEIETQSRKTKQLKKWLILFSRLIALSSLILAFALPYFPSQSSVFSRKLVSIYIDNSQSMLAEGENGQLFENAKNKARQIIKNLPENAEIQIIDNSLNSSSNKIYSTANALRLIDELDIHQKPNDFFGAVKKIQSKYKSDSYGQNFSFLISDFQVQESIYDFTLDSSYHIYACPEFPNLENNLVIDSVWLVKPTIQSQEPIEIMARIHNYGQNNAVSSKLSLQIDGTQRLAKSINIPAGSYKDIPISFVNKQSGWIGGELSITDIPIVFDNTYYFSVLINPSIKVLELGKQSDEFLKIFSKDSIFDFTHSTEEQLDYSSLSSFDYIILNQLPKISSGLSNQLKKFVFDGGILSVIPNEKSSMLTPLFNELGVANYQSLANKQISISPLSIQGSFYKGAYKRIPSNLFLPQIQSCYGLNSGPKSDKVLYLKDGSEILSKTDIGSGSVFQFTVPFDSNLNYVASELFVITQLKIAFSRRNTQTIASEINSLNPIYLPDISGIIHLKKGDLDIVTESYKHSSGSRIWLNDELSESGIYSVINSENIATAKLALNYSRKESHQNYLDDESLKNIFADAQFAMNENSLLSVLKSTKDIQKGSQLWKVFILLCLIFLLIEILLLRFLKS